MSGRRHSRQASAHFVKERSLHFVAHMGNLEAFQDIMSLGRAEINETDQDGNTPLHLAAGEGHVNIVRAILDIPETNINAANTDGWTPLHEACYDGRNEIVSMLLDNGASINQTNQNGATPIYLACQEGHEMLVSTLIARQADVNIAKLNGVTPAYVACQNNHQGVVLQLIEAGADLNLARQNGATPIYIACHNNHLEIVKTLLRANVNINARTEKGCTPVYVACQFGHVEIAKELIDAQANLNTPYQYGWTPLFIACQNGLTDIVNLLVDAKVQVNVTDMDAKTPLHIAAECNHYKICDILVRNAARVDMTAKDGSTPLDVAKAQGSWESFFVLQGLPVSSATLSSLLGDEAKKLTRRMERDEAVASELVRQLQSDPTTRERFMDMAKESLHLKTPLSEHILLCAWKLDRMSPDSEDTLNAEGSLYAILLDAATSVLHPPVDVMKWTWFEEFLLDSAIWFQQHPLFENRYMYDELKNIVVKIIDAEHRACAAAVSEMIDSDRNQWNALTSRTDAVLSNFKTEPLRQDDPLLSSEFSMSKALQANMSESVLTEFSKGQFDAKRFYDTNWYLGQMILNAHGVNDWVQADVNAIFQSMIETGAAYFQRGPVKTVEACVKKVDRELSKEQFPATAALTDIIRCTVTFNTPQDLIQGMHLIRDHIANGQSPLKKVVRVHNGYERFADDNLEKADFAAVTLNLVFDPEGWWIRPMLIEVRFLLVPFLDLKLRTHQLDKVVNRSDLVEVSTNMRDDQQKLYDFLAAAATGDKKTLTRKLLYGQDPNVQDDFDNNTALHFAAQSDEVECVELLLRQGADPDLKNKEGMTVTDVAQNFGHEQVENAIRRFKERGRGETIVANRHIKKKSVALLEIGPKIAAERQGKMPEHRRKSSVLHNTIPVQKEKETRRPSIYGKVGGTDSTQWTNAELLQFKDQVLQDIKSLQNRDYATIFEDAQFGADDDAISSEDERNPKGGRTAAGPGPATTDAAAAGAGAGAGASAGTARRGSTQFDPSTLDLATLQSIPSFIEYDKEQHQRVETLKLEHARAIGSIEKSKVDLINSTSQAMEHLRQVIKTLSAQRTK